MKKIFKTSKRSIAAILTLCILLGIAGTCVYAATVMAEETTIVTEETTQELMPMMAVRCSQNYPSKFLGNPNTTIVDQSVSYEAYIHFDSSGIADYTIHYTDHSTPNIHTNPHYHTFIFVNGWWTPKVYHPGLPY